MFDPISRVFSKIFLSTMELQYQGVPVKWTERENFLFKNHLSPNTTQDCLYNEDNKGLWVKFTTYMYACVAKSMKCLEKWEAPFVAFSRVLAKNKINFSSVFLLWAHNNYLWLVNCCVFFCNGKKNHCVESSHEGQ